MFTACETSATGMQVCGLLQQPRRSDALHAQDKDSETDKWNEGEDDQDIENVKVEYFDLSILKFVSKVIVIEDDLICSDNLLNFMNDSLDFYQENKDIWSISGYTYPLNSLKNYASSVYLTYRGSSWGWATWKDRWDTVNWNMDYFPKLLLNPIKFLASFI